MQAERLKPFPTGLLLQCREGIHPFRYYWQVNVLPHGTAAKSNRNEI